MAAFEFKVTGPYRIPVEKGEGTYRYPIISAEGVKAFWQEYHQIAKRTGCYVFAMQAGQGITPAYIGKATKSFEQEVFTSDKLVKYYECMAEYKKGTPVLFFLEAPQKAGPLNVKNIKRLEAFLIREGKLVNPNLRNVQGTKPEAWGITGVLRSTQGKPSESAQRFRKAFRIF